MPPAVVVNLSGLGIAETAQLHAREVPRILGAVDMDRRDPDLQGPGDLPGSVLDRVPARAVDVRPPVGALRQDRGRGVPVGQGLAGRGVAVPRLPRDREAQAFRDGEGHAAADEDGGLEGRWTAARVALGLGLVVQQCRGRESAALGEGHDGIVRAGAGDEVGEPVARGVDLVERVAVPEGVERRRVEDVDAGRGRRSEGGVDKVELDALALQQTAERCCWRKVSGKTDRWFFKGCYHLTGLRFEDGTAGAFAVEAQDPHRSDRGAVSVLYF